MYCVSSYKILSIVFVLNTIENKECELVKKIKTEIGQLIERKNDPIHQ